MPALTRLTLVFGMMLSTAAILPAQDASPAEAASPERAEYDKLYARWTELIGKLRKLNIEYDSAKPDQKREIESKYGELVKQGEAMEGSLVDAAIKAYKEAPGKDEKLAQFLLGILSFQVNADDYEDGFELAKILLEGGVKDPNIYPMAGQSAFGIADFDAAEKYFKIAQENSNLSDEGKSLLATIPYYRETWPKEQKIRAAEEKADDLPRVKLITEYGEMEIELFENEAPNTVANFISLIEKGFYDGLTFHRVLPMSVAQAGCPDGTGGGGPGYTIACECVRPEHRCHFRGSLSMAKTDKPNSGGSQFFICFVPAGQFDGQYTAFGRVIKGLDILSKIRKRDPEDANAGKADKIVKMEVIRKRDHEYVPKKFGQ